MWFDPGIAFQGRSLEILRWRGVSNTKVFKGKQAERKKMKKKKKDFPGCHSGKLVSSCASQTKGFLNGLLPNKKVPRILLIHQASDE